MKQNKIVYRFLIGTFGILYLFVAFVSFMHAIEFFGLGNNKLMSILLAASFEVGQVAVLFGLLTTHNKHRIMAWFMMVLLTTLQVTANVFSTFKFMVEGGGEDWTYWQRSILFWVEASGAEMYQVIISWIIGALIPIIALGMTALVSDNIKLYTGDVDLDNEYEYEYEEDDEYEEGSDLVESNVEKVPLDLNKFKPAGVSVIETDTNKNSDELQGTIENNDGIGVLNIENVNTDTTVYDPGEIVSDPGVPNIPKIYEEPKVNENDQIRLDFEENVNDDVIESVQNLEDIDDFDIDEFQNQDIEDIINEPPPEDLSQDVKDGVEVVDVKAISKDEEGNK